MNVLTPRINKFEDPTLLSDEEATIQGKKIYDDSVYSIIASGYSVIHRGIFIPYRMQGGSWRMRFTITGQVSSAISGSITLNGTTFENSSNFVQPCASSTNVGSGNADNAAVLPNSSSISWTATANVTFVRINGDVALETKPAWAI